MTKKNRYKNTLLSFISRNRFFSTALVICFLSLFIISARLIHVYIQNKTFVDFSKEGLVSSGNKKLDVLMEIPLKNETEKNCWQEDSGIWGSQYDITIINTSDYAFVNWTLVMKIPEEGRIDSSWNADYFQTPGQLTITGIDKAFTKTIHPHNSIKIGYVLYSNNLMESSSFYLSGRFLRNPLREIDFVILLFASGISLIVILVSLFFYQKLRRQAIVDNEKIESLLKLCANFIDTRDEYTKMHSTHVGSYSRQIAAEMGFDDDFQKNIYYMGMMHDVGKVLIPREILCKAGKLNEEEWKEMKRHTNYGGDILANFNVPGIHDAALHHHERYDGTGYPDGLRGEEIPIQARIIAVADSFDAMNTNRSYRKQLPRDVIISELTKNRGIQFDPEVTDALLNLLQRNELSI